MGKILQASYGPEPYQIIYVDPDRDLLWDQSLNHQPRNASLILAECIVESVARRESPDKFNQEVALGATKVANALVSMMFKDRLQEVMNAGLETAIALFYSDCVAPPALADCQAALQSVIDQSSKPENKPLSIVLNADLMDQPLGEKDSGCVLGNEQR